MLLKMRMARMAVRAERRRERIMDASIAATMPQSRRARGRPGRRAREAVDPA